jgi:N-acetyltransferase
MDVLGALALGRQIQREMKQLMLRHAFQLVKRAVFLILPQNIRSQKVIQKLGAFRIGSRPDRAGREFCLYAITSVPE